MPINTFGLATPFGIAVKMTPVPADRDVQINAYPGLDGLESLDLGGRGRFTEIRGILVGPAVPDLYAARFVLESFNDNVPRILYDSAGFPWRNVQLLAPKFEGSFQPAMNYGFTWRYAVVARHLTTT